MNQKLPLLLLTILSCINAFPQGLLNSRHSSYYTYLYEITPEETEYLYTHPYKQLNESVFHTLRDSFPTDEILNANHLSFGHFLKVYVLGNELRYELLSILPFEMQLLDNQRDLSLWVYDSLGNTIKDAVVHIEQKSIPFDAITQTYTLKKSNRRGLISIRWKGHTGYYPIGRRWNNPAIRRFASKVGNTIPLRYVIYPFRWTYVSVRGLIKYRSNPFWRVAEWFNPYRDIKRNYRGYFTTNQPMYRPGDTVKFKAFITNKKGRPIKKALTLTLDGNSTASGYLNRKLDTLRPYRPGAYAGEFVLLDSLDLRLGSRAYLSLRKKNFLEIMEVDVEYEDYLLSANTFSLSSKREIHAPDLPMVLQLEGKDDNELNLLNARAEIRLLPKEIHNFNLDYTFIPDTLWQHKIDLEPLGATSVSIPDSVFPAVDLDYEVAVDFWTADNEWYTERLDLQWKAQESAFLIKLDGDSLMLGYKDSLNQRTLRVNLKGFGNGHEEIFSEKITIPAKYPIIPHVIHYEITSLDQSDQLRFWIRENDNEADLQVYSDRSHDSLKVIIDNPRQIPFHYYLFQKNKELARGYGTAFNYAERIHTKQKYSLNIQYMWVGEWVQKNYDMPFYDNKLQISSNQPARIYPGQTTDIEISVNDAKGKPVPNVDVLAYSFTKKFKRAEAPSVPYLGKYRPGRKTINSFHAKDIRSRDKQNLNWPYWRKRAGLDSISYYQFLYPENGLYRYEVYTPDSLTQFAPFLQRNGNQIDIHMIWVDGQLIYYRGSGHEILPYSFPINSGYRKISLRSRYALIEMDSVYIPYGKKLILSLDMDHPRFRKYERERKLTEEENKQVAASWAYMRDELSIKSMSYLVQGKRVFPLDNDLRGSPNRQLGPFFPGEVRFVRLGEEMDTLTFTFEPGYHYSFGKQTVKMRSVYSWGKQKERDVYLHNSAKETSSMYDLALTAADMFELYQAGLRRGLGKAHYNNPKNTEAGFGKLVLHVAEKLPVIEQILFKVDNPDFIRRYPATTSILHQLEPGTYIWVMMLDEEKYVEWKGLEVKANGDNHHRLHRPEIREADSLYKAIWLQIRQMSLTHKENELKNQQIKEAYYKTYNITGKGTFGHVVRGFLTDAETGDPLIGASVVLKGSTQGTFTDEQGYFVLAVPANGVLIFSYVGYETKELLIYGRSMINVSMTQSVLHLDEVVVTALGISHKSKAFAAKVINLSPDVPGGVMAGNTAGIQVRIRGQGTIKNNPAFSKDELGQSEDLGDYESFDEAIGATRPEQASLRENFRDHAYWQPTLKTDQQGKARFSVSIPDDVTRWRTFVLAMNGHKQTGSFESSIQSYKDLMAQLSLPRFLIAGDSTRVFGKTLNYAPDSFLVSRSFEFGDEPLLFPQRLVSTSVLDTFNLHVPLDFEGDSIDLTYRLDRADGYYDGEKRSIPIFQPGTTESTGEYWVLENDTTFVIQADPQKGLATLNGIANELDILQTEIAHLHRYAYYCQEQIASKLIALLAEKNINEWQDQPFLKNLHIRRLINQLEKHQRKDGLWAWWPGMEGEFWVSIHVLKALYMATGQGYSVKINEESLKSWLQWEINTNDANRKLNILQLLTMMNTGLDLSHHIDKLLQNSSLSFTQHLATLELARQFDMPAKLDTLFSTQKRSLSGQVYWQEPDSKSLLNELEPTLIAYRILRADSNYHHMLPAIRRALLQKRNEWGWRNTYTSAQVIQTILPDILGTSDKLSPVVLTFSGESGSQTITDFPFSQKMSPNQSYAISKTGSLPLYLSFSQSHHNPDPTPQNTYFEVHSWWDKDSSSNITHLEAGKSIDLTISIQTHQRAEYVMIEVPIPAGCTYASQPQYVSGESYRTYARDKVNIYVKNLPEGQRVFSIKLLPRFSGSYTLNPVQVEPMYSPMLFGRNALRKVWIE